MSRRRREGGARRLGGEGIERAFDEINFGAARTLNLRAHLPTRSEAMTRAERWLRERQINGGGEVLVITGRGNASVDGVSVVRQGISELLASLRRRHVVATYREHTAGSFVVELAPAAALHVSTHRPTPLPPAPDPRTLAGLEPATRKLLRDLATIALQTLGVHSPTKKLVEDEMLRQFAVVAAEVPVGADREPRLRDAIERAIEKVVG